MQVYSRLHYLQREPAGPHHQTFPILTTTSPRNSLWQQQLDCLWTDTRTLADIKLSD